MSSFGFIHKLLVSLVLFTNVTYTDLDSSFVVTRLDSGDEFSWANIAHCDQFSGNSAYSQSLKCYCNRGRTFSTETMITKPKCQRYETRGHYRLMMNDPVSTVYLKPRPDGTFGLALVKTNTEQPLTTESNVLTTDNNCAVNYVEIIHSCAPQRVPLEMHLVPRDGRLYPEIQQSVTDLDTKVEGELFQANITCNTVTEMLMFKFKGSRILNNKGSFDGIPAYDPSIHSCSHITPLPINPATTSEPHRFNPEYLIIGLGLFITVVLFVAGTVLSYFIWRRCSRLDAEDNAPMPLLQGPGGGGGGGQEGGGYL